MIKEVEEKLEVIKERRRSSIMAELAEGRERKPSVVDAIAHKVRSLSTTSAPVIEENEDEDKEEEEEEKGVGKMAVYVYRYLVFSNNSRGKKFYGVLFFLPLLYIDYICFLLHSKGNDILFLFTAHIHVVSNVR